MCLLLVGGLAMPSTKVILCFDSIAIGEISNFARCHPSYFGDLSLTLDPHSCSIAKRLLEFVDACRQHDKVFDPQCPVDTPFDKFDDLSNSLAWRIELASGNFVPIRCPYFMADGQVTFQPDDADSEVP